MKALIVLGGSEPPVELLLTEAAASDLVVCADRGAAHCRKAGVPVDLLVGDLDSLDPRLAAELEHQGVECLLSPVEKDETDGQLALDAALEHGADEAVLLAATGGRLDHLLGNLQLLLRAGKRGVNARLLDGVTTARVVTGSVELAGFPGLTVSLLPAEGQVSVRYLGGLQYGSTEPLALPWDGPVGVSNRMTEPVARLEVSGWAFLMTNDGQ